MSGVFFDTNVVLYAIDPNSPRQRGIARALMAAHVHARTAVISTQVLQETYVNCIKKLGLSAPEAGEYGLELAAMRVIGSDAAFVLKAIAASQRWQLSMWDALIVNAAAEAGCATLYTEDLNHDQIIAGVRVVNPFRAEGVE